MKYPLNPTMITSIQPLRTRMNRTENVLYIPYAGIKIEIDSVKETFGAFPPFKFVVGVFSALLRCHEPHGVPLSMLSIATANSCEQGEGRIPNTTA